MLFLCAPQQATPSNRKREEPIKTAIINFPAALARESLYPRVLRSKRLFVPMCSPCTKYLLRNKFLALCNDLGLVWVCNAHDKCATLVAYFKIKVVCHFVLIKLFYLKILKGKINHEKHSESVKVVCVFQEKCSARCLTWALCIFVCFQLFCCCLSLSLHISIPINTNLTSSLTRIFINS